MPSDNSKIDVINYDSNFLQNGGDALVDFLNCTYYITATTDGEEVVPNAPVTTAGATPLNGVEAYSITDSKLTHVQTKIITGSTSNSLIKTSRMVVRLIGNSSSFNDDIHWRKTLVGGTYVNENLLPLISIGSFDTYGYKYSATYNKTDSKAIKYFATTIIEPSTHEVGYDYNLNLRRFQSYIADLHELELPNIYFNELYSLGQANQNQNVQDGKFILSQRPDLEAFVNRGDPAGYRDVHALKQDQQTETPPPFDLVSDDRLPGSDKYFDKSLYLRQYLTGAFINSGVEESIEKIKEQSKNIIFTSKGAAEIFNNVYEGTDIASRYPFYTKIKIPYTAPTTGNSSFTQMITDNNLEEEVLTAINKAYSPGSPGLPTQQIGFLQKTDGLAVVDQSVKNVIKATTVNVPSIDFVGMLSSIARNNTVAEADNEIYITPDLNEAMSMKNTQAAMRYDKSIDGYRTLQQTVEEINKNVFFNDQILEGKTSNINFVDVLENMRDSIDNRTFEVLAYKVDKFGGSPAGDNRQIEKLQTYMIFNDESLNKFDGGDFTLYDTQVKYGKDYLYDVYAYVIVGGLSYRYSDLRLSRLIGELDDDDEKYCLEFYEPNSGEAIEQLLNEQTNLFRTQEVTPAAALTTKKWDQIFTRAVDGIVAPYGPWQELPYDSNKIFLAFVDALLENENLASEFGALTAFDDAKDYFDNWCIVNKTYTLQNTYDGYDDTDNTAVQGNQGDVIQLINFYFPNYATNAQIKAENRYLADMHFDVQPTLKVIQVPIISKSIKITDHPPVACDVVPYQRKDNSNIIGFYINEESFSQFENAQFRDGNSKLGLYPTPMNNSQLVEKQSYLSSNNIIENEIIKNKSVSPATQVSVYRLNYRPTSLSDFDSNLVHTIDLSYNTDITYTIPTTFYEEQIATNQKFYYLFKFVNRNEMSGYISPIIIAELVDDGGYKYALFDTLFENSLPQEPDVDKSKSFKKLMQIIPNLSHTELDFSNTDFDKEAHTQLQNVEVGTATTKIWDKKFKFRLTSKKTGKKIDLNVTYKLRDS